MKRNGTDYEPQSLIACLDRHLRDHGATYSILKDKCFETSRKTLEGKAIELRQHEQKMKAEDQLRDKGALGCGDGKKNFNRTVFYTLSQHFGT